MSKGDLAFLGRAGFFAAVFEAAFLVDFAVGLDLVVTLACAAFFVVLAAFLTAAFVVDDLALPDVLALEFRVFAVADVPLDEAFLDFAVFLAALVVRANVMLLPHKGAGRIRAHRPGHKAATGCGAGWPPP